MVEYSGTSDIKGKDLNMHIAISSAPATLLAADLYRVYVCVTISCTRTHEAAMSMLMKTSCASKCAPYWSKGPPRIDPTIYQYHVCSTTYDAHPYLTLPYWSKQKFEDDQLSHLSVYIVLVYHIFDIAFVLWKIFRKHCSEIFYFI